jgi:hypothetical protein
MRVHVLPAALGVAAVLLTGATVPPQGLVRTLESRAPSTPEGSSHRTLQGPPALAEAPGPRAESGDKVRGALDRVRRVATLVDRTAEVLARLPALMADLEVLGRSGLATPRAVSLSLGTLRGRLVAWGVAPVHLAYHARGDASTVDVALTLWPGVTGRSVEASVDAHFERGSAWREALGIASVSAATAAWCPLAFAGGRLIGSLPILTVDEVGRTGKGELVFDPWSAGELVRLDRVAPAGDTGAEEVSQAGGGLRLSARIALPEGHFDIDARAPAIGEGDLRAIVVDRGSWPVLTLGARLVRGRLEGVMVRDVSGV